MAISTIKASLACEIEEVWNTVTSLENYSWRSDLSKIEVLENGNKFVEYTKEGYATNFTVTVSESPKRWEFDMENDNMKGHWIGVFSYQDGITIVDFTENVTAKKFIMKPFVGMYLKKQQNTYINDLRKALEG
ncbi:SRPBCC family protein [Anaerosporobacter sp.]|uniref:SRPBCC family protein n=1 Tax=Anaerosporobacter sp. TaxID=1872529 RepID=UPI00286F59F1|nr:SRPBCC family protein [Anaerosporobacter sp.]